MAPRCLRDYVLCALKDKLDFSEEEALTFLKWPPRHGVNIADFNLSLQSAAPFPPKQRANKILNSIPIFGISLWGMENPM